MKTVRNALMCVTALLLVVHLAYAAMNCQALTEMSVQLQPGAVEHRDKSFLGIGSKEVLPDYEIIIVGAGSRRWNLGFKKDTSAAEPIVFPVADPIPLRYVQTIIVRDKDMIDSDTLDTAGFEGPRFETARFRYTARTRPTFQAAMRYFFDTPLGIAISAGIVIGIAVTIVLTMML